jgi:hypothetical protein
MQNSESVSGCFFHFIIHPSDFVLDCGSAGASPYHRPGRATFLRSLHVHVIAATVFVEMP